MTSQPYDPPAEGGNVVPLRAADARTEVALDEDRPPGAADVHLASGEAQRRPVIPEHWRTREAARTHVRLALARHGHRAAYHGVRSPGYAVKALGYAVWGVVVTVKRLIAWWPWPFRPAGTPAGAVRVRRTMPIAISAQPMNATAGQPEISAPGSP